MLVLLAAAKILAIKVSTSICHACLPSQPNCHILCPRIVLLLLWIFLHTKGAFTLARFRTKLAHLEMKNIFLFCKTCKLNAKIANVNAP
jgi:hypothetical protein